MSLTKFHTRVGKDLVDNETTKLNDKGQIEVIGLNNITPDMLANGAPEWNTDGDLLVDRNVIAGIAYPDNDGDLVGGKIGLMTNDGGGNSNVVFNHVYQIPDRDGNAGRITVNVDSQDDEDAKMTFALKSDVVAGIETDLYSDAAASLILYEDSVTLNRPTFITSNNITDDVNSIVNKDYVDNMQISGANISDNSITPNMLSECAPEWDADGDLQVCKNVIAGVKYPSAELGGDQDLIGGKIGLMTNDGGGNSNITFNHTYQTPDVAGNAGRITVNVDNRTGVDTAKMTFALKSDVVANEQIDLFNDAAASLILYEDSVTLNRETYVAGDLNVYDRFKVTPRSVRMINNAGFAGEQINSENPIGNFFEVNDKTFTTIIDSVYGTDTGGLFVGVSDSNGDEYALICYNQTLEDNILSGGRAGKIFSVNTNGNIYAAGSLTLNPSSIVDVGTSTANYLVMDDNGIIKKSGAILADDIPTIDESLFVKNEGNVTGIKQLSQSEYDTLVSTNAVDDNIVYIITE